MNIHYEGDETWHYAIPETISEANAMQNLHVCSHNIPKYVLCIY